MLLCRFVGETDASGVTWVPSGGRNPPHSRGVARPIIVGFERRGGRKRPADPGSNPGGRIHRPAARGWLPRIFHTWPERGHQTMEQKTEIQKIIENNTAHGKDSGWFGDDELEDLTEDEERRMRETHEIVRGTNNNPRLHPLDPETGEPYCIVVYTNRKGKDWLSVNTDAVPIGYYDTCTVCTYFWRKVDGR